MTVHLFTGPKVVRKRKRKSDKQAEYEATRAKKEAAKPYVRNTRGAKTEKAMGALVARQPETQYTSEHLAKETLGERMDYRHGGYWLDGKLSSLTECIREANREREARGEAKIGKSWNKWGQ